MAMANGRRNGEKHTKFFFEHTDGEARTRGERGQRGGGKTRTVEAWLGRREGGARIEGARTGGAGTDERGER